MSSIIRTSLASIEEDSDLANIEQLPDDYSTYDKNFKIIVIGDSGVGKSCLTNKAIKDEFEVSYNATIGFEFYPLNLKVGDKVVKLQIWDTCGQELYRSLITNFYRSASLAILVYSIDEEKSFKNIDHWIKELKENNNPDTKLFLIGNKNDLEDKRAVEYQAGKKLADDLEMDYFAETSAKTGFNAKKVFFKAARILLDDFYKQKNNIDGGRNKSGTTSVTKSYIANNETKGGQRLSKRKLEEKSGCCNKKKK